MGSRLFGDESEIAAMVQQIGRRGQVFLDIAHDAVAADQVRADGSELNTAEHQSEFCPAWGAASRFALSRLDRSLLAGQGIDPRERPVAERGPVLVRWSLGAGRCEAGQWRSAKPFPA